MLPGKFGINRDMKVSDYIVEYLINKGVKDVFGYPGGMVTHLMDSLNKYKGKIDSHLTYHEQAAAFSACGYAQSTGKVGVAYATSGPGATNLITGICNAYFDSIPVLFITGQVNTNESKGDFNVRQRGFQETDIVAMVEGVTKYAVRITDAALMKYELDKAFSIMQEGRKGPVLLDIPMNIFRADIKPDALGGYIEDNKVLDNNYSVLLDKLYKAKRPVFLIGNGIKLSNSSNLLNDVVSKLQIPTVSSMLAVDALGDNDLNFGFIGAYGDREANFIVNKSDLVISLGARLDVRQVGAVRSNFAPTAEIVRVDIDEGELSYKVHDDEIQIKADVYDVLSFINNNIKVQLDIDEWIGVCNEIKSKLRGIDEKRPNRLIKALSHYMPEDIEIFTDVGQNQVWVAQSLPVKKRKVYYSGGHGAMGYSLPAAIGACIANKVPIVSVNGDGGIQMNIQELQTIAREKLPVKIIVLNNYSLGMIRHFQEMYFEDRYVQTVSSGGYTVPDFKAIANAYGINYFYVESEEDISADLFASDKATIIEIGLNENTYVFPKLEFGKPNNDQEPLMDRELFDYLNGL